MITTAAWHVKDMTARIPGIDWSYGYALPQGKPKKYPYDIELRHMIHWGKADARLLEKAFKVTLPNYVHEFYSVIQECVLQWKHSYHILRPEDAVEWEQFDRDCSSTGHLPGTLIRFCKVGGTSDSIAFRKHTQTGRWNIAYASLDDATEDIQSPMHDEWILAEDIDEWLKQMMENDGITREDDPYMTSIERIEPTGTPGACDDTAAKA